MLNLDTNNFTEIGLEDYQILNFYRNDSFKDRLVFYFINYIINDKKDLSIFKKGIKILQYIDSNNLEISDVLIWRYDRNKRNLVKSDYISNKRTKTSNDNTTTLVEENNNLFEDNINNALNLVNNNNLVQDNINNNPNIANSNNIKQINCSHASPLKLRIGKEFISSKSQEYMAPNPPTSPLKLKIGHRYISSKKPGVSKENTPYKVDDFFFTCQEHLFRRFLANLAIEEFTKKYFELGIFIHFTHL